MDNVPKENSEVIIEKPWVPKNRFENWLNSFFSISSRGSSLLKEVIGGLVSFLAMFYILPVNSAMFSTDLASQGGLTSLVIYGEETISISSAYAAVFVGTALAAGITTIIMGFYGKLPVGLAPAMGINAMISFNVIIGLGYNYAQAMSLVLVDGILFLIISATPLRSIIVKSIPKCLKVAMSAGIGFFIAFVGFQNAGIIVPDSVTGIGFGDFSSPSVIVSIIGIGLVLILSSLPQNKKLPFWLSKFSVIISMVLIGLVSAILGTIGVSGMPKFYSDTYSYSSIQEFSKIFGSCFKGFDVFSKPQAYALALTLLFIDFFDTTGTLVGVETGAGMIDKNGMSLVDDRPAMITDALGTCLGAVLGTTTVSSYVESASGVAAGARTGLAAVVTGFLFLLSLAIFPGLAMFSSEATSLALVFVGACMFKNLKELDWSDWIAVGSGFITVIIMLVSYSISNGIAWGFISYTIMMLASKRFTKNEIPVAILSISFVVLYIVEFTSGIK